MSETWKSHLEHCVKKLGYVEHTFDYPESQEENNFLNEMLKVKVSGKSSDDQETSHGLLIKYFEKADDFKTENYFYSTVMPIFEDLQKDIPKLSKACFPQILYMTQDCLIIEDPTQTSQFTVVDFDQNEGADFDHIAMLIGEMAKLHAVSFAWKAADSEKFNAITSEMENHYLKPPGSALLKEKMISEAVEAIENPTLKNRLRVASVDLMEKFKDVISSCIRSPEYSVVCHGGFSFKNSLFMYDESDDVVAAFKLNYQYSCLSSPALDFLYLMIGSASPIVWTQFQNLKDVYYECLRLSMNKFQLKVANCYPRDRFEEDIKRFAPFAVNAAIFLSRAFTLGINLDENLMFSENDEDYSTKKKEYEDVINRRIGHLAECDII